jgi:hypothetical protein
MFEVSYSEKVLPKLTFILRVHNAVYKLNRKKRKLKVLYCSPECKYSILSLVLKHQLCDVCGVHRAKYFAYKNGEVLKVCQHCKNEHKFDKVEHISLKNVEMHHDVITGMLKPCFH